MHKYLRERKRVFQLSSASASQSIAQPSSSSAAAAAASSSSSDDSLGSLYKKQKLDDTLDGFVSASYC
jgi:hypothetical protein